MFNKNDEMMAEKIAQTLHNIQVQHLINFDKEVAWLKGLNERFGEKPDDDKVTYYWDV